MDTDDFITMLANGAQPARRLTPAWIPVAAAAIASLVLMAATVGLRTDLAMLAMAPRFWIKLVFVAALALLGWRMLAVVAIPGARFGTLPWQLTAPFVLMALAAAATLQGVEPAARAQQFWGTTWRSCPFIIAFLALPIFAAMLHTMRARAPTRLRTAGAIAGFAAGAFAAAMYCLHCPELAPSFVGVWYVAGILIPTTIGALIGPSVLAW